MISRYKDRRDPLIFDFLVFSFFIFFIFGRLPTLNLYSIDVHVYSGNNLLNGKKKLRIRYRDSKALQGVF